MNIQRVALLLLAGLLTGAAAGHGDPEPDQVTVRGEIVDLHCYLREHHAIGAEHAECARRCLEQGQPMGLLTEDETLYVLSAHHVSSASFEAAKRLAVAEQLGR